MSTLKVNAISDAAGANGNAISLATDGTCTAKITNNLSNRNLIINGAMQVAQRGTSSTTNGYGSLDRWKPGWGGADEAITHAQHALTSSDTGPWAKGFRNSLHLTNGNQTSGAGAADYLEILYTVEAQDMANSGWEYTSASSNITISFWAQASVAQTYYVYLQSLNGTAQLYAFSFALSANTWTKVTKTIPGAANVAFDNNKGGGLRIGIVPFYGTDYTTSGFTLNTWAAQTGSNMMPDMTSTWWTTNDATFEITGVQLEVGDYATDFEHRSYGEELMRCYRYFQHHMALANEGYTMATRFTTQVQGGIPYFNTFRANPTSTLKGINIHVMSDGDNVTVTSHNMTIGGGADTRRHGLIALITSNADCQQGEAALAHGLSSANPMGLYLDAEL